MSYLEAVHIYDMTPEGHDVTRARKGSNILKYFDGSVIPDAIEGGKEQSSEDSCSRFGATD